MSSPADQRLDEIRQLAQTRGDTLMDECTTIYNLIHLKNGMTYHQIMVHIDEAVDRINQIAHELTQV